MQTYIVRVYRAVPADDGSVSGVIEDIESGRQNPFMASMIFNPC